MVALWWISLNVHCARWQKCNAADTANGLIIKPSFVGFPCYVKALVINIIQMNADSVLSLCINCVYNNKEFGTQYRTNYKASSPKVSPTMLPTDWRRSILIKSSFCANTPQILHQVHKIFRKHLAETLVKECRCHPLSQNNSIIIRTTCYNETTHLAFSLAHLTVWRLHLSE